MHERNNYLNVNSKKEKEVWDKKIWIFFYSEQKTTVMKFIVKKRCPFLR